MSCDECEKEQNLHTDGSGFYYRWKTSNILIVGCRKHVGEMIEYLNERHKSK